MVTTEGGLTESSGAAAQLSAYVPRLTLEWMQDAPLERSRRIEGTLVFVDVSGFTRMSERLATLGRAGAEEVNGVMNATFAGLLDVAYRYGGGLLKFGGDALLLFYDGEDHAPRAATAAFRMRALLKQIGRPATIGGRVVLRMHVGIHSGPFEFFLVGSSHRELVVAGPAATRTVEMEGLAEADEILLSDEAAALVSTRLLGDARPDGGRLLRGDPKASPLEAPLPDVTPRDLALLVPPMVRDVVTAGTVEAEHRHACVAFVHFGGTDAAVIQDPASAVIAVEAVVRAVQGAADRFGVCFLETDIDADGGRIVLVAGAPEASENDEERMLRALRAAFDESLPLPLRAGVNRGRVFAGEVGAPFRRTYTILGDTAALAARLMARARPDQVLATSAVLERSRTTFTVRKQPGFVPKGKTAEVIPLAVGDVVGTQTAQLPRAPLVGRTRELALLSAALGPVRMGFGTLVELVGDAGIGKSRLLEELRAHTEGMTVFRGACEQYEAGTPYFASRQLLRELIGVPLDGTPATVAKALRRRLADVAPELLPWMPLLAIPLDVTVASSREVDDLQPAFRRARLHGAVETLLQRLLPGPAALLLEDVHWMDEASSELLRHIAGHLATHPWFVCATRRPVAGGFSAAEGTPPSPR